MNKSIQISTRKSNSLYRFICKCSRERIIIYKFPGERVILCIDLYVSVCEKDYPASQWINLYKFPREGLILCINLYKSSRGKVILCLDG